MVLVNMALRDYVQSDMVLASCFCDVYRVSSEVVVLDEVF